MVGADAGEMGGIAENRPPRPRHIRTPSAPVVNYSPLSDPANLQLGEGHCPGSCEALGCLGLGRWLNLDSRLRSAVRASPRQCLALVAHVASACFRQAIRTLAPHGLCQASSSVCSFRCWTVQHASSPPQLLGLSCFPQRLMWHVHCCCSGEQSATTSRWSSQASLQPPGPSRAAAEHVLPCSCGHR